jgi:hypothetical protein
MFVFVLKWMVENKLLAGKTVANDSTMLKADTAIKSIVRRARVTTGRLNCGIWRSSWVWKTRPTRSCGVRQKPQSQEGLERRLGLAQRSEQPDCPYDRRSDARGVQS